MKVKSESEVAQSCWTLSNPMDCSLPDSSVHGIFQARVLEWGAIAFSVFFYKLLYIKQMNNNKKMGMATNMLFILDDRVWETKLQNFIFVFNK